jgi:predicted Rossmann fold nucleotide-binding protein DprA/Smf involved in DNA uptake
MEVNQKYDNEIKTVQPNESAYPKLLKEKLRGLLLPSFYYVGNISLLDSKLLGMAGSRNIDKSGYKFAYNTACKAVADGYGMVSGGARGVDYAARKAAIDSGGALVEFVPDTLKLRAEDRANIALIESGRLLMLSSEEPTAEFSGKAALGRNKYIYASAVAAVVVRCDYEKGGSWSGALYAMKYSLCPVYTWNNKQYEGNQGLISLGAEPIDANWQLML